jgi:succinyl-CoA synthetase beta subunit
VKLQEADAKTLLVAQGLPVPDWAVAHTVDEARAAASRFLGTAAGQVVIKAQVLVGGRGKAGGVKLASSPDEAADVADAILGMNIKGMTVRKVLVGPAADIVREYYLAAVVDRAERRILLIGSAEGGVEIEHVAETNPDAIVRRHADPLLGLLDFQARDLIFALGLGGHLRAAVSVANGLVRTMTAYDADLVEINPLAVVREPGSDGATQERLVCLDAKITLDDSALARHPGLEELRDPDEEAPEDREAREAGLTFIKLDGSIGCMVNGAGLAMTTMDLVKRAGGEPANFLDIGGGARADKVAHAMRLILADPKV